MKGLVYFILNSERKVVKYPAGRFEFTERDDPDDKEWNFFHYVFVDKFGLEWVNEEDAEHMNLTIKQWDHREVGGDSNTNCGACLCCDIRSRNFALYEFVVFVISSHGTEENEPMIIMSDGHELRLSSIVNVLSDTECPSLAGKTRVIMVQACRSHDDETGTGRDEGVTVQHTATEQPNQTNQTVHGRPMSARPRRVVDVEPPRDFLVVFASPSGFEAFRHRKTKSWMFCDTYIAVKHQELAGVENVNFLQILTEANNLGCQRTSRLQKVDENGQLVFDADKKPVMEECKNTMCIYHRLTKQPVFKLHINNT